MLNEWNYTYTPPYAFVACAGMILSLRYLTKPLKQKFDVTSF